MSHHPMGRRQAELIVLMGDAAVIGKATGRVSLVGAGPGDPELLTVKALRRLQSADVVVYDRLIGPAILRLIPKRARRLYVGKRKSEHSVPQADLNDLLVALARQGSEVVRLKGGDPFVFGRGGEEMLACRAAGVVCEVVPGISAALAAAAGAGAPLTHRGISQAVTFVTGHAATGAELDTRTGQQEPNLDWEALAAPNQTVVIYMGLSTAATISARLIAAGRSACTPALIVENASQPQERRMLTSLGDLPAAASSFQAPSILIIGEVAGLAELEATEPASDQTELRRA